MAQCAEHQVGATELLQDLFDRQARIDALRAKELLAGALRAGLPVSLGIESEGSIEWLPAQVETEYLSSLTELHLRVPDQAGHGGLVTGVEVIVFVRIGPDGYAFPSMVALSEACPLAGHETDLHLVVQRNVCVFRFQRRATVRVQPSAPPPAVALAGRGPGEPRVDGDLVDVSLGGGQVLLPRVDAEVCAFLESKPEVVASFSLPTVSRTPIELVGRVTWVHVDVRPDRGTRLGIHWSDLAGEAAETIRAFVAGERRAGLRSGLEAIRSGKAQR